MSVNVRGTLVALFALAASANAQILPGPITRPFPAELQNYLELSRDQASAILRLNNAAAQFQSGKLRRTIEVQNEIAQETAKTTIDPMALGVRYLELEAIRREITADGQKTYSEIQKVLTDAQKTKVQALTAAMRLQNVICDAQSQNILPPAPPNIAIGSLSPVPLPIGDIGFASFLLGRVPGGCALRTGDFLNFLAQQPEQR